MTTLLLPFLEEDSLPEVRKAKLSDLKQDEKNLNLGSERGQAMIENSFSKFGAGRSLVLDKNGTILCGNHSAEAAASIGMEDVVIVPTDGKQLVCVQRMDLDADDPMARELAIADNRSSEVSLTWDPKALKEDWDNPEINLQAFFTEEEVESIFHGEEDTWQDEEEKEKEPQLDHQLRLKVDCRTYEEKEDLRQRLLGEGFIVLP
tara:strand:+ start:2121 stop:2735 length:615 start_codon:yes stop_codon:yes gene_type:complete